MQLGMGTSNELLPVKRGLLVSPYHTIRKARNFTSQSVEGHTIARPGELGAEGGLLVVHLEPHGTVAVPRLDVLSIGDAGQVELHGARVVDVGVGGVFHRGAGRDGQNILSRGRARLEAANLSRVDIANKAVVLPVVGPADVLPVGAAADLGKGVVGASAEGGAQESKGGGQHGEGCGRSQRQWLVFSSGFPV